MGMELAQHVTHGAGGFLELGGGGEPQLRHGVDDAPLDRLQAVSDVGQGAVEDDVHGVVQIRLLRKLVQGHLFDAFQVLIDIFGHVKPWLSF